MIDHVGGLADLDAKLVRCIGDPDIRFREDPVRMLRAVRFASRLGFKIEAKTYAAIQRHHAEIMRASPPRLLEEIIRLFAFGSAEAAFRILRECGLISDLFPELDEWIAADQRGGCQIWACLAAFDRRTRQGEDLNTALKFASLFCAPFFRTVQAITAEGGRPMYVDIARSSIAGPAVRFVVPKRAVQEFLHLMAAQPRLEETDPKRSRQRFVAFVAAGNAVLFHEMAKEAGCVAGPHVEAWKAVCGEVAKQSGSQHGRPFGRERGRYRAPGRPPLPGQPRKRRRRRRSGNGQNPEPHDRPRLEGFKNTQDFMTGG